MKTFVLIVILFLKTRNSAYIVDIFMIRKSAQLIKFMIRNKYQTFQKLKEKIYQLKENLIFNQLKFMTIMQTYRYHNKHQIHYSSRIPYRLKIYLLRRRNYEKMIKC
jgi:hypothetical protein